MTPTTNYDDVIVCMMVSSGMHTGRVDAPSLCVCSRVRACVRACGCCCREVHPSKHPCAVCVLCALCVSALCCVLCVLAVSYTHLTLPTIYSV